ncbi:MAG: hypothetical protein HUU46_19280 [Candidatus Hydrogenedentes bacterium]|nr:hypothetical protein [Candidatus Hydrogenedentota bacterium]
MKTLETFRLWLEPDNDIPQFNRLRWDLVPVPVADVLLHGVHPWMGPDKHPSLEEAFLERFNQDAARVTTLTGLGYTSNITSPGAYYGKMSSRFERLLENIRDDVYFVDELTYLDLLEIAKGRIRETWDHGMALRLAEKAHPGFQDLRQFLKSKDKRIKLSSYDDIDNYNLGALLSLEDFADKDTLLIAEGIPTPNFRHTRFLQSVTDEQGRLRLVPELKHLTMTTLLRSKDPRLCGVHIQWHVTRSGNNLTFHPDVGGSPTKRAAAEEFATRWRTDRGRLVFQTDMEHLSKMTEVEEAAPSFPRLNYKSKDEGQTAYAELRQARIEAYHIGKYPTCASNGEQLREVLRTYGVPMTGNKEELLAKLAKLAAQKYAEKQQDMNAYFTANRLVLVTKLPATAVKLSVLEDVPTLHCLLLTMYALRHLRGNAILEPNHENNTYTTEELALALVNGKVSLVGGFVRAA